MRCSFSMSGKDKGGPIKGGFLDNILCPYTVIHLCNEIHGVYTHNINMLSLMIIYYSGNHLYYSHLWFVPSMAS